MHTILVVDDDRETCRFITELIAAVGAYQGFYSRGGALGVGRATTNAVVGAIVLILAVNYLITAFFVE